MDQIFSICPSFFDEQLILVPVWLCKLAVEGKGCSSMFLWLFRAMHKSLFHFTKYLYPQQGITSQYSCQLPEHSNFLGGERAFPREVTNPDFLIKQQRELEKQTEIQMPASHPTPWCVNSQKHLTCPRAAERRTVLSPACIALRCRRQCSSRGVVESGFVSLPGAYKCQHLSKNARTD